MDDFPPGFAFFFFSKMIILDYLFLIYYNELVGVKNKKN